MKRISTIIKAFILPSFFMMAISVPLSAQSSRGTTKRKAKSETKAKKVNRNVPTKNVTYTKPKKKVVSRRNVPNRTVINHKGQKYYYDNHKYYTQSRGHYVVIPPKVGFRIKVLPPNYRRVPFRNYNYYNAYGIFYIQINNEYEVVDPEIGTIVYELPDDYEKVIIDGETYYEYANILYEKIQVNGARAYEVVGFIEME